MTKKLSLLFVLFLLSTLTASAYDLENNGIFFNLDPISKQATVTNGGEYQQYVTGSKFIPAAIAVDDIFYDVTSIGDYAFSGCFGLTSIEIPNSVTSIGKEAFAGCSGLTSIEIPNSVTNIAPHAFDGCSGLTSVTIPNSVTEIGIGAFAGCSGMTSVTIGNSVTTIGGEAFSSCSNLTSLTIGNSVTEIGSSAFSGCSSLTSVELPSSVTSIGGFAFISCSGLTSIEIPNSVTEIGNGAFHGCSGLTSITIPNSVTSLGYMAFSGCSGLTSATIPNSVAEIGWSTFARCSSLTDVYCYAASVPTTDSNAFSESPISSATLHVPAGSLDAYKAAEPWSGFGNIVKIQNCVNGIYYNFDTNTKQAEVTYLNEILSNPDAYKGSVTIPATVTYNDVTYSVTSIGEWAFGGSSGLTEVVIPNSVTSIGDWAFFNCSGLKEVTIPSSVTSIGHGAFSIWSGLTDVYCYAGNVPTTDSDAFSNNYIPSVTLHVPAASVDAYKSTEPWSGFGTIKTLSGEIPVTPKCATPTISYENGKLTFSCDTEGATCQYSITDTDIKAGSGNEVQLTTTYKVTVYATKDGYENSDVATKDINVGGGTSGLRGDVNNDGTVNMPDAMFIVNKILNGKFPDE